MTNIQPIWNPLLPDKLFQLFKELKISWWIAGGWAIDLFIGHQTRSHEDTDIVIIRRDQKVLQEYFSNWDLQACDPPGCHRQWEPNEFLESGINSAWCRLSMNSPWAFQIMFMDSESDYWIFRRDKRIRRLISELGLHDTNGIPFLKPEIQLLFKATGTLREKDNIDFLQVMPLLAANEKQWLEQSLHVINPSHPWLDYIKQI